MATRPELVVRGGRLADGGGGAPRQADLLLGEGRILAIGRVEAAELPVLDAGGALVAPGFIDIHSHSDFTLLLDPRAVSALHQGVTTEVIGNCGYGCFPLQRPALAGNAIYGFDESLPLTWSDAPGYMARLEAARPAVNVLTLVPNGQLRLSALGMSDRPSDAAALDSMGQALEAGLEAGAWGYSTGLEYPAEAACSEEEIAHLCRITARHGALYATHTRDRDAGALRAVEEALTTAAKVGVRLQVSHLLPRSGQAIGDACVAAVERARAGGQDVAFDMHTRLFGFTYLAAALPSWAQREGPEALRRHLSSPADRRRMAEFRSILSAGKDWSRVLLLDNDLWPAYGRRDIAAIAAERGQEPYDCVCDLLLPAVERLQSLMVMIQAYSPAQQHAVFAHPDCMPASDATTLAPDGPLAGKVFHGAYTWAAWFWRTMVIETRRLSEGEAIHKLTRQPADRLGLSDRGRLEVGARADLVVFDPARFGERGTTFDPNQLAAGMRHVVVNGRVTLADGRLTGERAGAVIRRGG